MLALVSGNCNIIRNRAGGARIAALRSGFERACETFHKHVALRRARP
jgi:hypothetical protein